MKKSSLQKKIMRRVYYVYALRTLTRPGVLQGASMMGALIALTYYVSLWNVLNNMEHVGMGGLGQFVYNAVTNTEAWTLLLIGVIVFSLLSFRVQIAAPRAHFFAEV